MAKLYSHFLQYYDQTSLTPSSKANHTHIEFLRYNSWARFKRHATAVPNSIDRIKFGFSTAVAGRLKPSHATAAL